MTDTVISNDAAKNMADELTALLDAGTGAGKIEIWAGTKPDDPTSTPTGTKLAELTLNDPSFPAATDAAPGGLLTANTISDDSSADASGTAAFFRAVDSAGNGVIEGDVGTGTTADLQMGSTSITAGATVSISAWTITMRETPA